MGLTNAVLTFNGVMEYQMWAGAAGADVEILHVTERGGQLIVTFRQPAPATGAAPANT